VRVWPGIVANLGPDIRLDVIGECNADFAHELAGPGIYLHGQVRVLAPYYARARVFIVPTRYCAGLPLKAVEAAANGLPVVATERIAAQLGWQDEVQVADAPDAFERACVSLHSDETLWQEHRRTSLNAVSRDYSSKAFAVAVRSLMDEI